MKKRQVSQFKKNPLVRFIRWVLRFFDTLFKPKKGTFRSKNRRQYSSDGYSRFEPLTNITKLDSVSNDRLITVGELLQQVKWQSVKEIDREIISDPRKISLDRDVNLN
jgi:hypothetical protein